MRVGIHESWRECRVAEIDHLRVAWNGQVAANIDNLVALNDNDAIWNERFRFPIEHALGFQRDDIVSGPDWNRSDGEGHDCQNKARPSLTNQDIHSPRI